MRQYLCQLKRFRLYDLPHLIIKPWEAWIRFNVPSATSTVEMMRMLFPEDDPDFIGSLRADLLNNSRFFSDLRENMLKKRPDGGGPFGDWRELLYMIVRRIKPEIMFETGVLDGQSSAAILQALKDNGVGLLVSVDLPVAFSAERDVLPATPSGCRPGWMIPDYLRDRHRLVLGDSREKLPLLFKEYPKIDIFFHDSLHTFKHMYFEFTVAWPHIVDGGLLISHDILLNLSFHKFCRERRLSYRRLGAIGCARKAEGIS